MSHTIFRCFGNARKLLCGVLIGATSLAAVVTAIAQQPGENRDQLKNPVFRVANNRTDPKAKNAHPLDPALTKAASGLKHIRDDIVGYSCTMVKRERINGEVSDYEYMYMKLRNRKVRDGKIVVPLAVYMNFLKPANIKGREVLYIEGENNGKMIAHEGGGGLLGGLPGVWLRPDGVLAMRGNRYPITEVGIENLVVRLIEKGERDKQLGTCKVNFFKGAKVSGRVCTMIQVTHHDRKPEYDFHVARIFIDDELNIPIRYSAYDWPAQAGGKPQLLEEYTYMNMKLNPGLQAKDFDPENEDYRF